MNPVFDGPRSLEDLGGVTAALLHQAGVQLAIAEAGTGGEVVLRLAGTIEGTSVVTQAQVHESPEALALALRVSPAKVDAFGAVSAMVGAEAAADLIDTYEGGWGLVVLGTDGNQAAGRGVQTEGVLSPAGFVALGTPSTTIMQSCSPDQLVRTALNLLREQALRRLAEARSR